jgi:hypothetical protein
MTNDTRTAASLEIAIRSNRLSKILRALTHDSRPTLPSPAAMQTISFEAVETIPVPELPATIAFAAPEVVELAALKKSPSDPYASSEPATRPTVRVSAGLYSFIVDRSRGAR